MSQDESQDVLVNKLVEVIAPEAAFLRATEEGARFSPGVPGLTEAAMTFYNLLATGFVGAIAMEIVKGSVKEIGKFVGTKLMALLSHWLGGGEQPKPPATLTDASGLLAEARKTLTPDQFADALAAGGAALRERLVNDGFPPLRAERLSAAIVSIAQAHADAGK